MTCIPCSRWTFLEEMVKRLGDIIKMNEYGRKVAQALTLLEGTTALPVFREVLEVVAANVFDITDAPYTASLAPEQPCGYSNN